MATVRAHVGVAGDAQRYASVLAAVVLSLFVVLRSAFAAVLGPLTQVPLVASLFAVPLLCAFPRTRALMIRYRWPVLAVQGVLTWVPFAIFGRTWVPGIGGLLAGMVLLLVSGRMAWFLASGLLTGDVVLRTTLTGLPPSWPAWYGVILAVATFVNDGLTFFGMVRLAQLVEELQEAQRRYADLAVATERLRAAEALRSAVGERLVGVAANADAVARALPEDAARAQAEIVAGKTAAREIVAQVRAVTVGKRGLPPSDSAARPTDGAVIASQLAWAVLVIELSCTSVQFTDDVIVSDVGSLLTALAAVGTALVVVLQLRHSRQTPNARAPRAWPLTLGLQAVLAYVFFIPPARVYAGMVMFLAGSVLLLVRGRWRWIWFAAVVVSWTALYTRVPLRGVPPADRGAAFTLYQAGSILGYGLLVYGLARLAGLARNLEDLRGRLARMAAVRERLRVARDVHDLLGLGLAAIVLKADLVAKLIGRDDARAAAEAAEIAQLCATVRAETRMATARYQPLSFTSELAAARQILTSVGVKVEASVPAEPLPPEAEQVLAPVLREAVTNILRHAAPTICTIDLTAGNTEMRLTVTNNGAGQSATSGDEDGQAGHGLPNLTDRVQAVGGWLSVREADGLFELTACLPRPGYRPFGSNQLALETFSPGN